MTTYLASYYTHITCVMLSGSLFALRGFWMITGSELLEHRLVRILPHIIDTLLLTAAISLMVVLHQNPIANTWLTVKVVALLVYIVLGMFALRRGRTPQTRIICFALALMTFGFMVSVALTRHPAGVFSLI